MFKCYCCLLIFFTNFLFAYNGILFNLEKDFSKLEDNCFTMLCWCLPYNHLNQTRLNV